MARRSRNGDDALELGVVRPLPAVPVAVADVHLFLGTVQHGALRHRWEAVPRCVHGEPHRLGQALEQPDEVLAGGPVRPGLDGAAGQRQTAVGDDQLGVDLLPDAQAGALRAGAERRVEGERTRLQLVQGERMVVGAGQPFGVAPLPVRIVLVQVDELQDDHAVGQAETRFHRVGDALLGGRPDGEPVDHHLDGMLLLLLQLRRVGQLVDRAVDTRPGIALGLQIRQQVDVLALAFPDDRGQHLEPGALRHLQDPVDDLLRRLLGDDLAADRAVRMTDARIEQPQVVVDLGDRADRRPGVARGRLLVDGDGRRQPLDEVDVGLVHLTEELAGVGGQRLDVAPLAFREDGVEGQRGLAGARQSGEDHHGIARQTDVHVAEVVFAGAPHDEVISHGSPW